jgi:hypothetical protein
VSKCAKKEKNTRQKEGKNERITFEISKRKILKEREINKYVKQNEIKK